MPKKKEKRADGRYQVSVSLGRDPITGKRKQKYFYGDTQKEAYQKRDDWFKAQKREQEQAQEQVQQDKDVPAETGTSVSAWADKWLSLYGQGSYAVIESNNVAIGKIKAALGNLQLENVRKSDIRIFANSLSSLSFSSVKKVKSVIYRLFQEAVADHLILTNPCNGVSWDYANKGTHRALEQWEKELIIKNWQLHRAGIWCMAMLFAGLRRGELIAIKGSDIDLAGEIIHVTKAGHFEGNRLVIENQPKSLAGIRDLPILAPLMPCLKALALAPDELLCQTLDGEPITETAFKKSFDVFQNMLCDVLNERDPLKHQENRPHRRNLSKAKDEQQRKEWEAKNALVDAWEAKQKKISFRAHDLRHTYCTMLYDADVDLKSAQYLMGHADSDMTLKVYTHLSESKKLTSVEKLKSYANKLYNSSACQDACQNPPKPH